MNKRVRIGIVVLLVLVAFVAAFQVSYVLLENKFEDRYTQYLVDELTRPDTDKDSTDTDDTVEKDDPKKDQVYSDFILDAAKKLAYIDNIFRENYIGELDDKTLIDNIIAGYVYGTGDDYAAYYTAEGFDEFMNDYNGETAGIGVTVIYNTENKCIEIVNVNPESPAMEAGLLPGDLIAYVGEGENREYVPQIGYNEAVNKIRGEIGTEAVFTVIRGEEMEEIVFRIKRAKVTETTVTSRVYSLDDTVGVVQVTGFDAVTPGQFIVAVERLMTEEKCDKIVIDLRNNPGGGLDSIVKILDYIVPEGPIVRIMDNKGNEVRRYNSDKSELNVEMAVLVNENTASAAELFTSAVRDYNKATIVGTTTYGKGCMQTTLPLSFGGAVSVTYRMYNPPFSENYHGVGIVPDIIVELDPALENKHFMKYTDEEDNQLQAAVASFYNKD